MLDLEDDYPYCPNWKYAHYNLARLGPKYYPIDIYRKFETHRERIMDRHFTSFTGTVIAVVIVVIRNAMAKKPIYATPWKHVLGGAGAYYATWLWTGYKLKLTASDESRYIHFMESNPHLFPPRRRIKIGDIGKDHMYDEGVFDNIAIDNS